MCNAVVDCGLGELGCSDGGLAPFFFTDSPIQF